MTESARDAALVLAEDILTDIEFGRLPPQQIANKASRLARLVNDPEAMDWLVYEVRGYPKKGYLDEAAIRAAERSARHAMPTHDDDRQLYHTASLGALTADRDGAQARIVSTAPSLSGEYLPITMRNWSETQAAIAAMASARQQTIDSVLGAIYQYVARTSYTLRFGAASQTAFETVRADVDANINELVPDLSKMLAAAWESSVSNNPEHWASAAGTCRRAIKATADALRSPGEPVNGHPMGDENYKNRLLTWIHSNTVSGTERDLIESELEHLSARLDAVVDAGHKGVHADVSRELASRFIVSTYLLIGDVLRIGRSATPASDPLAESTEGVVLEQPEE